jgi:hypothetical protein
MVGMMTLQPLLMPTVAALTGTAAVAVTQMQSLSQPVMQLCSPSAQHYQDHQQQQRHLLLQQLLLQMQQQPPVPVSLLHLLQQR